MRTVNFDNGPSGDPSLHKVDRCNERTPTEPLMPSTHTLDSSVALVGAGRSLSPLFIGGGQVVTCWPFEFEDAFRTVARVDELALQRWRDERIVEEKFFYDPAQMKPAGST